jgi:ComF family protein
MAGNAAPPTHGTRINALIRVREWLYPSHCALCAAASAQGLCLDCRDDLLMPERACRRCALPLAATDSATECGRCLRRPPPFDHSVIPCLYAPPLDVLITRFKFGGRLHLTRILASLLVRQLDLGRLPEAIVPVPLHPRRLRSRGFNQALELGRCIAHQLHIPLLGQALSKIRHTEPQTSLDLKHRRHNLQGAFRAGPQPLPAHVALLDDVVTTGATTVAAAAELKRAGVTTVTVWAIARTP